MAPLIEGTRPPTFTSLRDMIIKQADKHGDAVATHWVGGEGKIEKSLSFNDLKRLSFNFARYLKNQGVEYGDRVALIHAPSADFFVAFLACQVLRAVPIPIPCPTPATIATDLPAIISLLDDANPAVTILHGMIGKLFSAVSAMRPAVAALVKEIENKNRLGTRVVDVFDESLGGPEEKDEEWEGEEGQGLSFIQYTSGSTSKPKGVMVSQRTITYHLALVKAFLDENLNHLMPNPPGGRYKLCGWVPHWFDYSLVACSLWSLHEGTEAYMMSPVSFMANPLVWMQVIAENKINISLAPNFAYGAVIRAWKSIPPEKRPVLAAGGGADGRAWDLSNVCQLHSGGEPIQGDVVREFFKIFADAGLKFSSFRAGYGMAEHVVAITIPGISHDPLFTRQGKVSVGEARFGVDLKIVDPNTLEELPAGQEGEIWVTSESKADGYWGKSQEECDEVYECKIKEQEQGRGYLRTGDLGFLDENQLFISGRLKDVIIIAGKNYFPADIEHFMDGYEGVLKSMAFSLPPDVETNRYSLIYLVEVKEDFLAAKNDAEKTAYCEAICQRIVAVKGLEVTTIVLLAPNTVPKTNTGKLGRATARTQFLAGETAGQVFRWNAPPKEPVKKPKALPAVAKPAPKAKAAPISNGAPKEAPKELVEQLRKQWESILQVPVGNTDNFYVLGGSSLTAVRLTYAVQNALKCLQVNMHDLLENPTLEKYAARISELSNESESDDSEDARTALKKQWLWEQVVLPDEFINFRPEVRAANIDPVIAARPPPENVFLTGGTGIVGSFILSEFLGTHRVPSVYCLVRAKTPEAGHARLVDTLKKYNLWKPVWAGRIIPVVGDLTSERFGMTQQTFRAIADDIKLLLHCGASTEFFRAYTNEEGQNVVGTKEALRLALSSSRGTPIPLHHVSTIAIFDPKHYFNTKYALETEADHPPTHSHSPGYSQTKWVAEQLVQKASRDYNLPAAIYRVGSVLGDSTSGASFQLDGPIFTAFANFEKLGAVPKHMCEMNQPLVTVDYSARAIACSAVGQTLQGQVAFYHVINGQEYPGQRLIEVFESVTGKSFEVMDSNEWWNLLDHSLPSDLKAQNLKPLDPKLRASLPGGQASVEFLALSSAFMPRGELERDRMRSWFGRGFSTTQLRDRLRRLRQSSPVPEAYDSLLEELDGSTTYTMDRALAVSLKWAIQETKRLKMAANRANSASVTSPSSASTTLPPSSTQTAVVPRYTPKDAAVAKTNNAVTSWLWSTPVLAFFSMFLWILLGE